MQDIERILSDVKAVLTKSCNKQYRTTYEHQNALHAALEKLDDADKRAIPFSGNRADEVKASLLSVRKDCLAKLQSLTSSSSNSGSAGSSAAVALPGSDEWLRQLQAEDEIDQEHERRASGKKGGGKKGGKAAAAAAASGAAASVTAAAKGTAGHAAGELASQRERKNDDKQLGAIDVRLVNLVHPHSEADLAASLQDNAATDVADAPREKDTRREIKHETHRDCLFSIIAPALLSRSATVRNVEGQPWVEISFQPEKRKITVSPRAASCSSFPAPPSGANNNNDKSNSHYSARENDNVAAQLGYLPSPSSGQNSRGSTPGRRSPGNSRKETPSRRKSKGSSAAPDAAAAAAAAAFVEGQEAVVDCETKITMFRPVFDALWALTDSAENPSMATVVMQQPMCTASAAEKLAMQVPVLIGGSGAAGAVRRLGGMASEDDKNAIARQEHESVFGAGSASSPSSAAAPVLLLSPGSGPSFSMMPMQRSATKEFLSPNDGLSFPSLTSSEMTAAAAAGAQSSVNLTATSASNPQQQSPQQQLQSQANNDDDDEDERGEESFDDEEDEEEKEDKSNALKRLSQKLARENAGEGSGSDNDNNNGGEIDYFGIDVNRGVMAQTRDQLDISAGSQRLNMLATISIAPWTVVLCHGGYFAGAVYVQGVPIIHKAFHRYTVRKKQGGKQSNQEGIAGSAGSQIRKAQEKKFGEDVQVILDAWRGLIDASWFVFYAAPSPSNRKLLVTFNPAVSRAAVQEKPLMYEQASEVGAKAGRGGAVPKLRTSSPDQSPLQFDDPRVHSVPMTTKRPVFAEVQRVYETLSRCTLRLFYMEQA